MIFTIHLIGPQPNSQAQPASSIDDIMSDDDVACEQPSTAETSNDAHTHTSVASDTESLDDTPVHPALNVEQSGTIENDVVVAILRAFALKEKMSGSQSDMMEIVSFARDLYCKGDSDALSKWPTTWTACMKILVDAGYKEPDTYYACLDSSHPNLWSLLSSSTDQCRFCKNHGTIEYHYLRLSDKVKRWCSDSAFCKKMTAHWEQRSKWMHGFENECVSEIWEGQRFSELSWFWNPQEEWLLPVRCTFCNKVVSADTISGFINEDMNPKNMSMTVECPHCYRQFNHTPQYTTGDPRNIALIGHWDGWQPFSTSIKHSCGKVIVLCILCYTLI